MIDPLTAGLTADGLLRAGAGIAGSSISGAMQRPKITLIKLGSRDERREAYANFLMACLALNHILEVHIADKVGTEVDSTTVKADLKRLVEMSKQPAFAAECAIAEMTMVATEPVLIAADVVRDVLLNCVMVEAMTGIIKSARRKSPEHQLASDAFTEACRAYIAVCRKDLWYTPRWWQFHRQVGKLAVWAWKKARRIGPLPVEIEKALDAGALHQIDARGKIGKDSDGKPRPGSVIPQQGGRN
ncbi:hypothetical protein [Streptomyces vietnamensis]|uniref:Uncharacterized protein n=1 Tax=Streptomyces vietnamensis TaxID=362257 RepID=A0A0B5HWZ7_9ACTN|nr:hypothetical protein [Streptomyces vietnamensis]AJF64966.1 hypothetical protein SVTN_11530 [Streptomyces vietnamensis]